MAKEDLTESDVQAQWTAHRISTAEHSLLCINELAARWQRARESIRGGHQLSSQETFTQGRMEGYVQALALFLMVPHVEIKAMLLRGELPYDESHRRPE
jgi:hypothetical protein